MSVFYQYNKNLLTVIINGKHHRYEEEEKVSVLLPYCREYDNEKDVAKKKELEKQLQLVLNYGDQMHLHGVEGLIVKNGSFYLENVPVPIPKQLVRKLNDLVEFPNRIESLKRFWLLCMANPDPIARYGFYNYVETFGVPISENGYAIMYKQVERVQKKHFFDELDSEIQEMVDFKLQQYGIIESPKSIVDKDVLKPLLHTCIYSDPNGVLEFGDIQQVKSSTNLTAGFNFQRLLDRNITIAESPDYKPFYKGGVYGNDIYLGKPVIMPRGEADSNSKNDCSVGLHVGSNSYVKKFYNDSPNSVVLACLINPMNVVAIPDYDHSKMRVSEYYPYAEIAKDENNNWFEIESAYTENNYLNYEVDLLETTKKQLKKTHIAMDTNNDEFIDLLIKSRKQLIS